MKPETKLIDFDDPEKKRNFQQWAGRQRGLWEITAKPRKLRRSLNANAFYHAAVVSEWAMWIREEYGDQFITHEQAHVALKKVILGTIDRPLPNGEVIEIVPTTHDMDADTFSAYVEKCILFLSEFCGIECLRPEMNGESKDKLRKAS